MCRELLLHELFHTLSPQQQLQSLDFLTFSNRRLHGLLVILIAPKTLIFIRNVLKFNSDMVCVSALEVCLDISDRFASLLEC